MLLHALLLCLFANVALAFAAAPCFADNHETKQYIEVRYYQLKSPDSVKVVDAYLTQALAPALNRAGSESIGIFREQEEKDSPLRIVVIAHKSINDFAESAGKVAADQEYLASASEYMAMNQDGSPLVRIRSELLHSFDSWPALKVPVESKEESRIFELRVYESSNEKYGDLKVEMFNSGEVPIFLDSGITPVFMGQAVVGDHMPNLTYMTVYKNAAAKKQAWETFKKHPDWKVLSANAKYKGTVSKIHKLNLVPVDGSQL